MNTEGLLNNLYLSGFRRIPEKSDGFQCLVHPSCRHLKVYVKNLDNGRYTMRLVLNVSSGDSLYLLASIEHTHDHENDRFHFETIPARLIGAFQKSWCGFTESMGGLYRLEKTGSLFKWARTHNFEILLTDKTNKGERSTVFPTSDLVMKGGLSKDMNMNSDMWRLYYDSNDMNRPLGMTRTVSQWIGKDCHLQETMTVKLNGESVEEIVGAVREGERVCHERLLNELSAVEWMSSDGARESQL